MNTFCSTLRNSLLLIVAVCSPAWATEISVGKHQFQLPDGFTIQQIAAPPLVQRPIHLGFDVDGVLYVTDSSGNTDKAPVQLNDPQHRVLRLVDRNGDGLFDESKVFADKLPFPEGILVHDGAVYVGAPPHIWKLRDTDGDNVADERTVWFDGGSIEGCGNDMHGPYYGPDGFFYWCKGAFAPQQHELSDGTRLNSRAAHIYRARPDGGQLEMVITGGMNNPVGLAFTPTGDRFLSGTFFDLSQPGRRDGILHAVYGGMYGRDNPRVLASHPSTGGLLPVMAQLGPAAPSGMVMPRHDALGLKGNLVLTEFNTRRVSKHQLSRSGSSYSATTKSLLESDQSDFHPTDVIEDADGSLLVADTGSWYMICCPTSKIAKPDMLGAIYRIRKTDSPPIVDPRGRKLDWQNPRVEWLADDRPAVVKRATEALGHRENIERLRSGSLGIPEIWSLHRIADQQARAAVRDCLTTEETDVCTAAIHSVALWRDRDAIKSLVRLLSAQDLQIRRLAAMALGRIGASEAVGPLLNAWSNEYDPHLKHAILYALYEIGDLRDLPDDHPVGKQVRLMQEIRQRNVPQDTFPEIEQAKIEKPNPDQLAAQKRRLDELAAFLPAGNAERGEKLFNDQERSYCTTCHLHGKKGVRLGPDLTRIGEIRTERDLLEAIVFPSASIARYHEVVNVLTDSGKVVYGLPVKETVDTLFLASAAGVVHPIATRQIETARYSHVSLMPDRYGELLRPDEIAHLVAYLKQSKLATNGALSDASVQQARPPHRAIALPGLHAYAQKSVAAGELIEFRVSSDTPYDLTVGMLGPDPDVRDADPVLQRIDAAERQIQPIHPGSYVHVEDGLPAERRLNALSLECWIRPFALDGWRGLISQHDYPGRSGIGLFLHGDRIAFISDNGGDFNPASLHETEPGLITVQRWHHVVGTWDGQVKRIFVDGELVSEFLYGGEVRAAKTALRIGAYGNNGVADKFYDGDVAMIAVYENALPVEQIRHRFADRGRSIPKGKSVLACWSFAEERGTRVADAGVDGRHGQIVNRATWMIGGPGFDATAIGRHDTTYDPTQDPQRGHGLRLASDELYNARWSVSHSIRIPSNAKSGIYAGRFDCERDGQPMRYFTTFIVRRPNSRPKAPLLVLTSTNTWLAYNSVPFPVNHSPTLTMLGTGGLASTHPDAATYSGYRDHRYGQPTYKIGLKLPWPAAGPDKTYIDQSYSHLMRGERFLHLWLDRHQYDYDVITDRDLDQHPEVLRGYQAVVINGHSEYWSARAYRGIDDYLKAGGDAVVLSGNTMFWRVSFDESNEVMEVRKFGTKIGGRRLAQVGELYHSHDFRRGSLMRFCGYPAWKVIGLTCIGWGGEFKPYRVDEPDHFLFKRPHQLGLKLGDPFGFIREGVGAVGHEFDVRLSTLQGATKDSAIEGLVEPKGIVTVASSRDERAVIDYNATGHEPRVGNDKTIAEIIYWERPEGGRVFHSGSIATSWGIYHDETMGKLLKNVLHQFGVEPSQPLDEFPQR